MAHYLGSSSSLTCCDALRSCLRLGAMRKVQLASTLCLLPGQGMQRLKWHLVTLELEEIVTEGPSPGTTSMNWFMESYSMNTSV